MSETATTPQKSAGAKPDWTSSDKKIAIWMKEAPGKKPRAQITYKNGGDKVYMVAYPEMLGIKLSAADIGSMLEDGAVFSDKLQSKAAAGQEPKNFKGFICMRDVKEVPWKANPSKSDNVVELAVLFPIYWENSDRVRGFNYNNKTVFTYIKSGEHKVGELTPRQVVRLIEEPDAAIQFGQGEGAYTVKLDHFDPPGEGFKSEIARLSVTKGEAHKLLEAEGEVATPVGQAV